MHFLSGLTCQAINLYVLALGMLEWAKFYLYQISLTLIGYKRVYFLPLNTTVVDCQNNVKLGIIPIHKEIVKC